MGYDSGSTSPDGRDEDDEDEYEEVGGGNRLLGFMFGNVDNSGDLDVDYLDEDAKEHLAALADKLGPSLTEIDLSVKSPQQTADSAEQDYDEKAEDAVDYEDIDEQYEGPETQVATEEDHLLPKRDYFSNNKVSVASLEHTAPVFDDDNYDEDEDFEKEQDVTHSSLQAQPISSSVEQVEYHEAVSEEKKSPEADSFSESADLAAGVVDYQEGVEVLERPVDGRSSTPLPVLYIEDEMVILRFSEIFGIHEPLKKGEKRERRYSIPRERYKSMNASSFVEEDEEAFLKSTSGAFLVSKQMHGTQDDFSVVTDGDHETANFGATMTRGVNEQKRKDHCLSAEPMKVNTTMNPSADWWSPLCPNFYPLDQEDWEDRIIWDNSPSLNDSSLRTSEFYDFDPEAFVNKENKEIENSQSLLQKESDEKDHTYFLRSCPVQVEPFGSREVSGVAKPHLSKNTYHPQLLRLETHAKVDDSDRSAIRRFNKLTLQNSDLMDESWLEDIIWEEPRKPIARPNLILDLQDEQMLFEILENKDSENLRLHAGAMIVSRSSKSSSGDSLELPNHGGPSGGRFNIANDKFYSNRKTSQQMKSHSKKRTAHGVKVLHSVPALKLQTMKPKLSNKDIANFHRPKALWYPHDNEVVVKEQAKLSTQGPMKIIFKSLGGKGSKLHVDADETISSVKAKASKKLDFKQSEPVKIFYMGKELEDARSLAEQNVRPNSLLHLVRTKIHLLPRAQKLPGENKSLRPPGAFKKKSDLSVKDGHVFLMEYCEERPLLLGNVGMGARLCTYYQKHSPDDQTGSLLRSGNCSSGSVLTLEPADKSPFLGDIRPGSSQSCLETNMYRAPIFSHKVSSTDYLLVRSAKGKLSIRRIDRIDVVGQQEPHIEVMSPGTKGLQTYIMNRLLVYLYREFCATEKRGLLPCIRADELSSHFPNLAENFLRKRLKHCADLQKGSNGQLFWVMRRNFRIPLEEELRRMLTPENVCSYESMQAGLYALKRIGITRLTHPTGISAAMNQLPDEAIALAAASHIERELQITPWNLSSNFVSCTNQDRGNIERLEITGVGDPSGRGLGFSYVRTAPKAPVSNAVVKKKAVVGTKGSTVTGTDADLRRLSMEAAREVLLKFNVPDEQIAKQTRWHRIAMIRKLSSEQATSGFKVDPTTISKYARGQRMSFLQLQQQTREKCQEIWDRQLQSLSAIDGEENESDTDANSDLDSFAGDLENLLDAEECEEGEEGNDNSKHKMRRRPSQAQAEEEIEDEAAEAAELCRMLMDDDEEEQKKKKKTRAVGDDVGPPLSYGFENAEVIKKINTMAKKTIRNSQPDESSKQNIIHNPKVEHLAKAKLKAMKTNDIANMGTMKKKVKILADGIKVSSLNSSIHQNFKEKKSARETFVCGACGQLGHMRTNKNCPKYGEELEMQIESFDREKSSAKSKNVEPPKVVKKLVPKTTTKNALVEPSDGEKSSSKAKIIPLKIISSSSEKLTPEITQSSDRPIVSDAETGNKSVSTKVNKIVITNKMKSEDSQLEPHRPSIVIRPPAETEPRKKIIIKRPKEIISIDEQFSQEGSTDLDYRKTKKIVELSSFEKHLKSDVLAKRQAREDKRWWEEEEKRRIREDRARKLLEEERRMIEERERLAEITKYQEAIRIEREEEERLKAKKKKIQKKKRSEMKDEYTEDFMGRGKDRRIPERDRNIKRRPVVELGKYGAENAPPTKRRRGGEVGLANILEKIVETLKERYEVSYLFLKPVSRKEAPDYLDIIKHPMDLSTIREKVRRLEYKSREEFRHDVWQITYNAHIYNDGRNPGIPPLADQLLELCDYLLSENDESLTEAEAGIDFRDM